jgi:DNA-binding XRE family transcriptional regulator
MSKRQTVKETPRAPRDRDPVLRDTVLRDTVIDDEVAALIKQCRDHRRALRLSTKDVADAAHLSRRAIFLIESLKTNPKIDTFLRYAAACGGVLSFESAER